MEINKANFLEAGVHFGHYKNKWHPKMKEFIFSVRNRVHIMDFKKMFECLKNVSEQVRELSAQGCNVLFVGKKKQISELMKNGATECGSSYMVRKWPGGFLTNFKSISREVNRLQNLASLISSEHFKSFPKKNQVQTEKRYRRLCETYEGVLNLKSLPDALFIMGLKSETTAVREAKLLNIPIIAVCDTDTNPVIVDYLIPGNDDGTKSLAFFINLIVSAIKEGRNLHSEGSSASSGETQDSVETSDSNDSNKE